jgi:GNAT superfamily N-acetyltransferase
MRFEITPQPNESIRACAAIARAAMRPSRMNLILFGLYAAVALGSYILTPTHLTTFVVGMFGVVVTTYALQFESRERVRGLRDNDPHARETHFVERGAEGVHTWCTHLDARYSWNEFGRVIENKEFYLFVRPSGAGAPIPKRLIDEAADTALRERIVQWSPDRGAGLARTKP